MEQIALTMPEYREDYNMLYGAVGYIGGKEVIITHRNPATGELWIEPEGKWIDSDKVSFSKNPTV